jgi:hypothetical protein
MQIAAMSFTDVESSDEAWAGVRLEGKAVGLALSLRRNGDLEVFFGMAELDLLISALQKAREALSGAA